MRPEITGRKTQTTQAPSSVERLTYTVEEAAEILGISRALAYRKGVLPTVQNRRQAAGSEAGACQNARSDGLTPHSDETTDEPPISASQSTQRCPERKAQPC